MRSCRHISPFAIALTLTLALMMAFANSATTATLMPEQSKALVKVLYVIGDAKGFPTDTGIAEDLLGYSRREFGMVLNDPQRVKRLNECPANTVCDKIIIVRELHSIKIHFDCREGYEIREIHIDQIRDDQIEDLAKSLGYQVGLHDAIPHKPSL